MKREWLKEARKAQGLTLKDLAAQIGCSFNYLSDLELGKRNPSLVMADKLARALEFSILNFLREGEKSA